MFTFAPLQGALTAASPSQSILELDGGVKVLIDVGWDESFDIEKLKELEKQVPTISLILLTHATIPHLAAYAHCCKNFPQFHRIPIYATKPVIVLGRMLLQDVYASTPLAATTIPRTSLAEVSYSYAQPMNVDHSFLLQPPSAEEIAKYFSLIQELKYSQPTEPPSLPNLPPLNGLTITAYNSGRSLGGTIWHIQHGLESIVYGVDWGQYKENIYDGAAWIGSARDGGSEVIEQLRKPTALVCSTRSPPVQRPDTRDEQFIANIQACVEAGGTVLVPVDSSARLLELAYMVEHAWRKDASSGKPALSKAKLYMAGRTAGSLFMHARTMLEWMNDATNQEFERSAENKVNGHAEGPFDFKYLRVLERKAQVDWVLRSPTDEATPLGKVILASDTSLEWGMSKQVLRSIAADPKNLVILTEVPGVLSSDRSSLARTMWDWWQEGQSGALPHPASGKGRQVEVRDAKREALEGAELTLYQQWLATQRQLQATMQTGGTTSLQAYADVLDDVSSESSDDSEDSDNEQQGKALNVSTTMGQASRRKVVLKDEDLGINILVKKKGHYDFDVRAKKGRERMFPIPVKRKREDDYGELIRPEDYLREEEREEDRGDDRGASGSAGADAVGKTRKWDDLASKRPSNKRNHSAEDRAGAGNVADAEADDELNRIEDETEEVIAGPAKLVVTSELITVNLNIAYVDFSGLHTERNLELLLPLVQPRKLVLVGGTSDETTALAAKYKSVVSKSRGITSEEVDVFCPAIGVTVDASVDTHAWTVKLADNLVRRLKWQDLRGLGIVTVTGQLQADAAADDRLNGSATPNKRQKTEDGDVANSPSKKDHEADEDKKEQADKLALARHIAPRLPMLDVLPATVTRTALAQQHQPLHVGELRLADLRRVMQSSGHTAEFRGEGTLVVDGSVAVKKTTAGRVEVESIGLPTDGGPATQMGGTFYAVKRVIYEGLAVVAGA